MNRSLWVDGWAGPLRVVVVGVAGYVAVAALLRISGKRTPGKLNAFDWVGTVAIGSTLANLLLSPKVPLFTGLTALGLLVLLQYGFSYAAMRWPRLRSWMRVDPTMLLRHGSIDAAAAHRERVADQETISAVRAAGGRRIGDARFVHLEPDGSLVAIVRKAAG